MRSSISILVSLTILLLLGATGIAQEKMSDAPPEYEYQNVKNQLQQEESAAAQSDNFTNDFLLEQVNSERWYIIMLCTVSLVSLIVVLIFVHRASNHSARDIVNASGLNLIIFGTIILVLIVDTTEQLTAAIGVLGAIAGYLFGTIQKRVGEQEPQSPPKPPGT